MLKGQSSRIRDVSKEGEGGGMGGFAVIVLDTHSLVWWVNGSDDLSRIAKEVIEKERKLRGIFVSTISVWEIAMLVQKGRLKLTLDIAAWVGRLEKVPFINFVSVDNTIALKSVSLPEPLHKDTADRIIIATARELGATLVTSDKKILDYEHVQAVW